MQAQVLHRVIQMDWNHTPLESCELPDPVPAVFSDIEAAPLLCAGAIGYRSLRLTGLQNGSRLGLAGFGASAHLVLKIVRHGYPDARVFVFSRSEPERLFARQLGAEWAGDFTDQPPELLDCVIDTTPAWKPVVESPRCLRPEVQEYPLAAANQALWDLKQRRIRGAKVLRVRR